MLFMVIETFRQADLSAVGERYKQSGRMLPADVVYHASWVERTGQRCFQLIEALDSGRLSEWTCAWDDLVDFEIIPVETSAAFWAQRV